MNPALIAGLASAGTGALGFIQNQQNIGFQQKENRLNREFDRYMLDRQHDYNVADWNAQNLYNTPAAQMERLKAAGLNPNLIYGNGQATIPASSMPGNKGDSHPGIAPRWNFDPTVLALGFMQIMEAQAKTENIRASTELLNEQSKLTEWESKYKDMYFPILHDKALLDNEWLNANIAKTVSENEYIKMEHQFLLDKNAREAIYNAQVVKQSKEETALIIKKIATEKAQKLYIEAQTHYEKQKAVELLHAIEKVQWEKEVYKWEAITKRQALYGEDEFKKFLSEVLPNVFIAPGRGKPGARFNPKGGLKPHK